MSTRRPHYWREIKRNDRPHYRCSSSPSYCFFSWPNRWPRMSFIPSRLRYAPFHPGGLWLNFADLKAYSWYWRHGRQREQSGILCRSHGVFLEWLLYKKPPWNSWDQSIMMDSNHYSSWLRLSPFCTGVGCRTVSAENPSFWLDFLGYRFLCSALGSLGLSGDWCWGTRSRPVN